MFSRSSSGRNLAGIDCQVLRPMMTALRFSGSRVERVSCLKKAMSARSRQGSWPSAPMPRVCLHTPTTHAVRGERFKYIRYHGLWDTDELYDLQNDPHETTNLIFEPEHKDTVIKLNKRLFELLAESGGTSLRLAPDRGPTFPKRHPDRSEAADFPGQFYGTSE